MLAVGIEAQHTVAHAAVGCNAAVDNIEFVDQGVGIDAVKSVPGGKTGAGQIVDPRPGLFGPGFIAIEPLPERPEGQPGSSSLAYQRLMCGLVNHKAVDAIEKFLICGGFQSGWRPRPGGFSRGHGLGGGNVLAVDVRH